MRELKKPPVVAGGFFNSLQIAGLKRGQMRAFRDDDGR